MRRKAELIVGTIYFDVVLTGMMTGLVVFSGERKGWWVGVLAYLAVGLLTPAYSLLKGFQPTPRGSIKSVVLGPFTYAAAWHSREFQRQLGWSL